MGLAVRINLGVSNGMQNLGLKESKEVDGHGGGETKDKAEGKDGTIRSDTRRKNLGATNLLHDERVHHRRHDGGHSTSVVKRDLN